MTDSASAEIDAIIARVADWRGPVLARMRALILAADPGIEEAVKWKKPTNPAGVPVWSRGGIICTGETYRGKVKLTFARGALLPGSAGLFNGSLGGNTMRAIDITRTGRSTRTRSRRWSARRSPTMTQSDRTLFTNCSPVAHAAHLAGR